MNTITISRVNEESGTPHDVTYTEAEVLNFIKNAKEINAVQESYQSMVRELRNIRNITQLTYQAIEEYEVTADGLLKREVSAAQVRDYFKQIEDTITENISVECYAADVDVDSIELHDIEEDN